MTADLLTRTFGPRFLLVCQLPTFAAGSAVLMVLWAGAPGDGPHFTDAWETMASLSVAEALLLAIGLTAVAMLILPLQLPLLRLMEGYWPAWLARPAAAAEQRHERRLARLERLAQAPDSDEPAVVQRAALAGATLRVRYPNRVDLVRPTALGNALAAAESRAGWEYGLDAVVAWPRLYLVLDEHTRSVVDDRRMSLDAAANLSVSGAVVAVSFIVLLGTSSWWVLLAGLPAGVAWLAYRGAVQAAISYGEALRAAFDLHRFDLLARLHLPLPSNQVSERKANRGLCAMWRQAPFEPSLQLAYRHHTEPERQEE